MNTPALETQEIPADVKCNINHNALLVKAEITAIQEHIKVIEFSGRMVSQKGSVAILPYFALLCFAAYARKILIDGYIIQIDHSGIKVMTAEILSGNLGRCKRKNYFGEDRKKRRVIIFKK